MKHIIDQSDIPQSAREVLALAKRIGKVAEDLNLPAGNFTSQMFFALADALFDKVTFGSNTNPSDWKKGLKGLKVALDVTNGAVVLTIGSEEGVSDVQSRLLKGISLHQWLTDNAKNYSHSEFKAMRTAFKLPS